MNPVDMKWVILDEMLEAGGSMEQEQRRLREGKKAMKARAKYVKKRLKRKRSAADALRNKDPW